MRRNEEQIYRLALLVFILGFVVAPMVFLYVGYPIGMEIFYLIHHPHFPMIWIAR